MSEEQKQSEPQPQKEIYKDIYPHKSRDCHNCLSYRGGKCIAESCDIEPQPQKDVVKDLIASFSQLTPEQVKVFDAAVGAHTDDDNGNKVVEFKSTPKFYEKEKDGTKNNTIRRFDDSNDVRFEILRNWNGPDDSHWIVIKNTKTGETFKRLISDVSVWGDEYLITWWREVDINKYIKKPEQAVPTPSVDEANGVDDMGNPLKMGINAGVEQCPSPEPWAFMARLADLRRTTYDPQEERELTYCMQDMLTALYCQRAELQALRDENTRVSRQVEKERDLRNRAMDALIKLKAENERLKEQIDAWKVDYQGEKDRAELLSIEVKRLKATIEAQKDGWDASLVMWEELKEYVDRLNSEVDEVGFIQDYMVELEGEEVK